MLEVMLEGKLGIELVRMLEKVGECLHTVLQVLFMHILVDQVDNSEGMVLGLIDLLE